MSAAPITAPTETTTPIARAANSAPVAGDAALFQLLLANTSDTPLTQPATAQATASTPTTASPLGVLALQTEAGAETPALPASTDTNVAAALPADPAALPAPATPETPVAPQATPQQTAAQPAAPQQNVAAQAQTPVAPQQIAQAQTAQPKNAQAKPDASTVSEETPADQPKDAAHAADKPAQPAAILPTALAAQSIAPQAAPAKAASTPTETSEAPVDGAAPIKFAAGPKKTSAPTPTVNTTGAQGPTPAAVNSTAGERVAAAPIADTMSATTPAIAPSSASAQPASTDAATQAVTRPALQSPAAMSLAQQIVRRFDGQSTSFQMRMDPPELGKVEVRLTVDRNKKVTASVSADNPQALTELRASSRELERALNEAGLDLAQNGLSFDLNDDRKAQGGDYASASGGGKSSTADDDDFLASSLAARPFGMERWGGGGVDVWA